MKQIYIKIQPRIPSVERILEALRISLGLAASGHQLIIYFSPAALKIIENLEPLYQEKLESTVQLLLPYNAKLTADCEKTNIKHFLPFLYNFDPVLYDLKVTL